MTHASEHIAALARQDPAFERVIETCQAFPGFPTAPESARSTFAFLAHMIIYQQISVRNADTIHARVCALTPGAGFPEPMELREISDEILRSAGLSKNKTAAIRDLASRVALDTLDLEGFGSIGDADVIDALTQVQGIGPWTAKMFLIFRLGRLDVLADDDLGLRRGMRWIDNLDALPNRTQLLARAELWRPFRSVASWYLWRYDDARRSLGRQLLRTSG